MPQFILAIALADVLGRTARAIAALILHASICAGGFLLTCVARYGRTRCLLHTAKFVRLQGVVGVNCPDQRVRHTVPWAHKSGTSGL